MRQIVPADPHEVHPETAERIASYLLGDTVPGARVAACSALATLQKRGSNGSR